MRIYIGTYTKTSSKGIYLIELDEKTGMLGEPKLAAAIAQPSYVALHPSKKFLFAISEVGEFEGKKTGAAYGFAVEADGMLTPINAANCGGRGPAFIEVDRAGKSVLVANYGEGSVARLPIDEKGRLSSPSSVIQHHGTGPVKDRQEGPHAHSIVCDPSGKFALAQDLGTDFVIVYKLDGDKLIEANRLQIEPGSGPRMVEFAHDCTRVYLVNELNNTVCFLQFDSETGTLKNLQTVTTLPSDWHAFSKAAAIGIHPSQKFCYASNRGNETLVRYAMDDSGKLAVVDFTPSGGKTARHFAIDPSGKFLLCAHQDSDSMTLFDIAADGKLTAKQTIQIGQPTCVLFV